MSLEGLNAEEILEKVSGKTLDTKKNILEYIDIIKKLSKEGLNEEQTQDSYELIEQSIKAMSSVVKPNTIIYLKNELKSKLGKFTKQSEERENAFLPFFKETYPETKRTREYTWVLADFTKINEQQIIDTLKTINAYCLRNKLSQGQKKDIFPMIERIVDTQNVRLINQVRSMEGIRKAFNIKIVDEKRSFKIIRAR